MNKSSNWLWFAILHIVAIASQVAAPSQVGADDKAARQLALFGDQIQPLLVRYCHQCHAADKAESDFRLDKYTTPQQILEARGEWVKVLGKLRAQAMPPPDENQVPRPTKAEFEQLTTWLDTALNDFDCGGEVNPGRVTLRRLNRNEYRNTIRDLVDVDYQPVSDFPTDDVGYGFDNVGDVLSLSPILLEKYLTAAEDILEKAIVVPQLALSKRIAADQMEAVEGGPSRPGNGTQVLSSNGVMWANVDFPSAGKYEMRVLAAGDQAGPDKVQMGIRFDEQELTTVQVRSRPDRPTLHTHSFDATAGPHRVGLAFLNDYYKPESENQKERDRNLIVTHLEILGPFPDQPADLPNSHRRIFFVNPDEELTMTDAIEKILKRFASRAFRREVTATEIQRLRELVRIAHMEGETFEGSIRFALQAVLVSPHFLFRVEADPPAGDSVRQISELELATRLSYFLWSSMPDEELFKLAWKGELRKDDQLQKQVVRMLKDPKAQSLVENFATQWLNLRLLDNFNPDKAQFPAFTTELRAAMKMETQSFFQAILQENRPISDFLTGDFTFVNEPLGKLYGLQNVSGDEFRRVSLAGVPRRGILTHASILSLTSNPTRTSPVKRGKWVLENVLGEPPPSPPPNVPELMEDENAQAQGSLRERMQQHRANPNCAVCHERMDAIGFAFENFDVIGSWRTKDGNFEIDSQVNLPTGESLQGWEPMLAYLAHQQREPFVRCFAEKLLTFALGRGLEYYDKCAVDKIMGELKQNEFRIGTLFQAIVSSEPFQKRAATRK